MRFIRFCILIAFYLVVAPFMAFAGNSNLGTVEEGFFTVTVIEPENGSVSYNPAIPADGRVAVGTEILVKANPASGYGLDCVYSTYKGGMWGTTSDEYFTSEANIIVDKDMSIGATFVESSLVENINVTQDVVYGQPGVKKLKYDVFSSKGAQNLPCVVIIHGGGWSSNVEDVMRGLARELAKDGQYVVFSIDYRWINTGDGDETPNTMNMLIEDVYGAIAHIQEHAAEYGGNPARIAVTGDSAGGHLSACAADMTNMIGDGGFGEKEGVYEYMPTYLPAGKSVDQVCEEISAAIQVAAPSYGVFSGKALGNFVEGLSDNQVKALSPINNIPEVSDRAVPQLLLRGTEDFLIGDEEVQAYADALEAAGQKAEYIQVEGAGHAFFDWKPDANTRSTFVKYGVPYASIMKEFFDAVFY